MFCFVLEVAYPSKVLNEMNIFILRANGGEILLRLVPSPFSINRIYDAFQKS